MFSVAFDGLNGPKMSVLTHWKGSVETGNGTNFVFVRVVIKHQENSNNNFAPECNGQSETMMSAISNSLAKNIDDEANWDSFIRFIQLAYKNIDVFRCF
jgi:hypothetical protein